MLLHGEPPLIRRPLFCKLDHSPVQTPKVEAIICLNFGVSEHHRLHHAVFTAAEEYLPPYFVDVAWSTSQSQ